MRSREQFGYPGRQGLYDPAFEKDSCGVGFVAHIKGERSHQILVDAYKALTSMDHRGARGCEPNTGDGAGVLTALPYEFLVRVAREELGTGLPSPGKLGAGIVFLPTKSDERKKCKQAVEQIVNEQGQHLVGWREVPTDREAADLGPSARRCEPHIEQLLVGAGPGLEFEAFERQLYLIRKRASHLLRRDSSMEQAKAFYVCSLSTKVVVYKGMLTTGQLKSYYPDLSDPDFKTHLAMIHSRFSTNTFPSWDRAQPNRFMSHNGEINTLRGNINWMRAREGVMKTDLFGDDLEKLFPVIEPDCSDSGNFDNALEFLLMTGRTLQEAVLMMIPEAWQNHTDMPGYKRAFYEYHSCLMEPWDGPASIAFTDGHYIGAVLDRNGLRPSRYYLTHDDRVIMASEAGVLPIAPELIKEKARLQPGRVFLVDFEQGRLVPDEELKRDFCRRRPYGSWLKRQRISLGDVEQQTVQESGSERALSRMQAFGYTLETMQFMLLPLVRQKRDPVGSMGNDSSLACLSDRPRMLYDYFKQLFAQVTNPPIDSIREEVIMSLSCYIGPERNLLDIREDHCHRLHLPHPILTNREFAGLQQMDYRGWRSKTIDITFERTGGVTSMIAALDRICDQTEEAIDQGFSLVILSDRKIAPQRVPLSALLACGAVHQHLVRKAKRTRLGLIVETGEAREVHHHCLLIGYGADAINPYLAFKALWKARQEGWLDKREFENYGSVVKAYRKGVAKGILKVMAKMGISTLQSYKGAQVFEAVGLRDEVIERCFTNTASRIQGVGFEQLARESLRRHRLGYPREGSPGLQGLPNPGEFHWRADGERHMWDPRSIADLQIAAIEQDEDAYWRFSDYVNNDSRVQCTLRSLMKFKDVNGAGIPLEEVESASQIVKRFCTGAMSFGSISAEAHETLAVAMNRLGGRSNTGEGGEDSERFQPSSNGDSRRSAIKQVASGRFGVTAWYMTNADELQIKIAQGAKPGEGGELPGRKVDKTIARIRYSTPGVGLISPPPHHDIYSIEDLAQLIYDLKNANPAAQVSVKLVSEVGVGTIAAGVVKAHADRILISGASGGTGASPWTSIKHAGLPWEMGIAETHQTLVMNDLRSRVILQTDGGMKTGRDVIIAGILGAEEIGFSTAPLITLGCIMMRKCHLNTCPVGIATQDPVLREQFRGKPEHVINYLFMVAEEARRIMARLGLPQFQDIIGRTDLLESDESSSHWKAQGIDLRPLLEPVQKPQEGTSVYCTIDQDHGLDRALDLQELLPRAKPALASAQKVHSKFPIHNTDRSVGAILSNELVKKWGENGLPDDTIHFKLDGSAGQSFGAFLASGITLELEGDANDYVGKGLSGGRLIIYPPRSSGFVAEENVIVGNVVLYGATGGSAFIRGRAAERFSVRNSGARTVIEGVGDHGCEYMTGGRAVILGPTGRNFAAGMSGGIAYVWDLAGDFAGRCNLEMIELGPLDTNRLDELRELIGLHEKYTGSPVAKQILGDWPRMARQFVQVIPVDYRRALEAKEQESGAGQEQEDRAGTWTAPVVLPHTSRRRPSSTNLSG